MSRPKLAERATYHSAGGVFDRLTLNGEECRCEDALAHFQHLLDDPRGDNAWCRSVMETLRELSQHGQMTASTSGTTGPPRQFIIPFGDLIASARSTGDAFGLKPGDKVLLCLPCEFVAGKLMLVRAFVLGLDLHVIDPRGSILGKLGDDTRFRFTAMVPLQLHRAIHENKRRVERTFDTVLLGGGLVSDALIEDLQQLDVRVFQSYGSTETVTHVALRRLNKPGPEDAFTAIGDVHFGRDPRGCLVVYTPHLSTKQHVTNDLIDLVDDQHFRWLGRHDHVILSGGKKIHPEQLEARTAGILPYPHYFTGVHDDVLGQAVMLVLETDRPQNEVMPEVLEQLMAVLHPHEWPRRVQALQRIQRTVSGKIIRG